MLAEISSVLCAANIGQGMTVWKTRSGAAQKFLHAFKIDGRAGRPGNALKLNETQALGLRRKLRRAGAKAAAASAMRKPTFFHIHCFCEKAAIMFKKNLPGFEFECSKYLKHLEGMIRAHDGAFDAARAKGCRGRTLMAIAQGVDPKSDITEHVRSIVTFHRCFTIASGAPAHQSATCIVSLADRFNPKDGTSTPVALKFMKHKQQFVQEIRARNEHSLDEAFVVGVLDSYVGDDDEDFSAELQRYKPPGLRHKPPIYEHYRYCVVLPQGTRSLHDAIGHDHIAGVADEIGKVKYVLTEVAQSLQSLHNSKIIHGDVKPLNVIQVSFPAGAVRSRFHFIDQHCFIFRLKVCVSLLI